MNPRSQSQTATEKPAEVTVENAVHVEGIKAALADPAPWVERGPLGDRLWELERTFYEERGFAPAWVDGNRTTPQMESLLGELRHVYRHGLDSAPYGLDEFDRLREDSRTYLRGIRFDESAVPELDTRMTYAYLQYAADLLGWSGHPEQVSSLWMPAPRKTDLVSGLREAMDSGEAARTLQALEPTQAQYKRLQEALARERQQPTGIEDRLLMNLERWRWLPRDLGDRYILVNVPSYTLRVMEGEQSALSMRVIVGAKRTPTPLFSDQMTYVVFSPYWNIPSSILRNETLPQIARDPAYLDRQNLEVVGTSGGGVVDASAIDWEDEGALAGLRIRQRPGPSNALGLVKFIFPNQFDVYLHDTPGDRLFAREHRTFSHGCIRVEDPVKLAEYVLGGKEEWTEPRITQAMNARRERTVRLDAPLPVHIGYWTTWVEDDGTVTLTDDPYKIDEAQARLIAKNAPQNASHDASHGVSHDAVQAAVGD